MNKSTIILFLLLCSLLVVSSNSDITETTTLESVNIPADERITSEPISIIGNNDPDWNTLEGDGSKETPYLIENLHIELNESHLWFEGIAIRNSTYHVIIRNCFVKGIYEWVEYGLHVRGVGVQIQYSSNVLVTNNVFNLTAIGIHISDSHNCTVEENRFLGNNIENNDGYLVEGIHVDSSSDCSIRLNSIKNCNTALVVTLLQSSTISNNSITSCEQGFYGSLLTRNVISQNNISYNSRDGLILVSSNYTLVTGNTCDQNTYKGIGLSGSHHNIISENIVTNTISPADTETGWGVRVDFECGNNTFAWNNFISNVINALCDSANNVFDYNYYSDYTGIDSNNDFVGDTPYDITGLGGIQDIHPRTSPDARPITITNSDPFDFILIATVASVIVVIIVVSIYLRKRE